MSIIHWADGVAARFFPILIFKNSSKEKGASLTFFTLNPDISIHHLYKMPANNKTQSGSAILPRVGAVDLRKGCKNLFVRFGNLDKRRRNPGAVYAAATNSD